MEASINHNNTVKGIAVLGATGSIGSQALDIIRSHPERYRAGVLAAGRRVDELVALAREFRPRLAVIADAGLLPKLRESLAGTGVECAAGPEALADCVTADDIDMVLTATVGYSGLEPTVRAIKAGKDIALANKETLVVAGDLINALLSQSASKIYPVDSEHSAIAQCLAGENPASVRRLIVTASGGPFRTWEKARIEKAKASDALRHPNWSMGAKITIDSATMMNKAFELIEAHHLFHIEPARVEAIVHPQSIVHSMVEFADGAIKAQLGVPDMHLPIAYAMGEHTRLPGSADFLDLLKAGQLTFEAPDAGRFPCFALAHLAMERRGNTACIINAANEIAVAAYLHDRIGFYDIPATIEHALARTPFVAIPSYEDYVASNEAARAVASEFIQAINK